MNSNFLFTTTVECFNEISDDEIIKNLKLIPHNERKCFIVALLATDRTTIIQQTSEEFIEEFTFEIAKLGIVDKSLSIQSINHCLSIIEKNAYTIVGGLGTARSILEKNLGTQKAIDVINRLVCTIKPRPFDFLKDISNETLYLFIKDEYIQTIVVVLCYLSEERCIELLKMFSDKTREKIINRMKTCKPVRNEVLREVERILERKCSSIQYNDFVYFGGEGYVKEINNLMEVQK